MNDAALVRVVHRLGQASHQPGGFGGGLRQTPQRFPQVAAVHELQRKKGATVGLADLVDLHDVGMVQPGDGRRLDPEARPVIVIGVVAGQDHLEGDHPTQADLPRLVDHPHAAAAQHVQDFVAFDVRQLGGAPGPVRSVSRLDRGVGVGGSRETVGGLLRLFGESRLGDGGVGRSRPTSRLPGGWGLHDGPPVYAMIPGRSIPAQEQFPCAKRPADRLPARSASEGAPRALASASG